MTFPITTTLDGVWQLRPADTFRQGFYPLDDETWIEQELPAHWQQHPLLEHYAGKLVYRKRFDLRGIGDRGRGSGAGIGDQGKFGLRPSRKALTPSLNSADP
jgi:hypothetical protein